MECYAVCQRMIRFSPMEVQLIKDCAGHVSQHSGGEVMCNLPGFWRKDHINVTASLKCSMHSFLTL